jgi:LysR family glycine cleavage system transcriptional activator
MTSRLYVESDLRAGRLALLFDMGEDEGCAYHLVRRPGPLRPGADAFARWVTRTARAE